MAISYMYRCGDKECQHKFETLQSMIDDPISECPVCKKQTLARIMQKRGSTGGGFILKSDGWFNKGGY